MPTFFDGLPIHVLLVHGAAVLIPLGALCALLLAVWPRFRADFLWTGTAAVAAGTLFSLLASSSGEGLEKALPESDLIHRHTELADRMNPETIVLLGLTVLFVFLVRRYATAGTRTPGWVKPTRLTSQVLMAGVALLTAVTVVQVGHAGSKAAWESKHYCQGQAPAGYSSQAVPCAAERSSEG